MNSPACTQAKCISHWNRFAKIVQQGVDTTKRRGYIPLCSANQTQRSASAHRGHPDCCGVAFPYYSGGLRQPVPLTVKLDDTAVAETELICHFQPLAVKALKEEMLGMIVRQLVRATAKGAAAQLASDAVGGVGGLAVGLVGAATEQADRRSWLSLPCHAQIARSTVSAGQYSLRFLHGDNWLGNPVDVRIEAGKSTVMMITRAGGRCYVRKIRM